MWLRLALVDVAMEVGSRKGDDISLITLDHT